MADNLTPAERARQEEEDAAWKAHARWRKRLVTVDQADLMAQLNSPDEAVAERAAEQLREAILADPVAVRRDGTTWVLDPVRPLVTGGTGGGKSSDLAQRWTEEAAS